MDSNRPAERGHPSERTYDGYDESDDIEGGCLVHSSQSMSRGVPRGGGLMFSRGKSRVMVKEVTEASPRRHTLLSGGRRGF